MTSPRLFTKKDLEAIYHIADTTVVRTLKACGLDTGRRVYTEREITTRFEPARKLFKLGFTSKNIQEYFNQKDITHENYDDQKRLQG